jgi:hypothetical protein
MQTPLMDTDEPQIAKRICAACAWCRGNAPDGPLFDGHNLAFCVQPDTTKGDGAPMVCQRQRFEEASYSLSICGWQGIFFTPRTKVLAPA